MKDIAIYFILQDILIKLVRIYVATYMLFHIDFYLINIIFCKYNISINIQEKQTNYLLNVLFLNNSIYT